MFHKWEISSLNLKAFALCFLFPARWISISFIPVFTAVATLYAIVLNSYISSSVTHVKRNKLESQGKEIPRDRIRVYHHHIQQRQYQQLKVERHSRVCGNAEFRIFNLLRMRSQNVFTAIYSLYNFQKLHSCSLIKSVSDLFS